MVSIMMTFLTVQLRQADLFVQSVLQTCPPPHPKFSSYGHSLHCCALPPPSPSACVNGPASWFLPWGDVVCMLLSVTSRLIVPLLPSPPPSIHNLTPFSLL